MKPFSQVFILGAPRSGTTFLASLLDRTKFRAPFETQFIIKYYKKLDRYGDLSKLENFRNLVIDIFSERSVQQWKIQPNIGTLYNSVSPDFSYTNIINEIILLKNKNNICWGDKTPNYLNNPEVILKLFPEAKFIFIVRDGRDVALSLLRKPWGPNNFLTCGEYWSNLNENFLRIREEIPSRNLLEIKYEEILIDPELHIGKIYDFLEESISADETQDLALTAKPDNSKKWPLQANRTQLRRFESAAASTLEKFDYPVVSDIIKINQLEKFMLRSHEAFRRFIFLFNTNIIDGIKIRFFGKEPFNE